MYSGTLISVKILYKIIFSDEMNETEKKKEKRNLKRTLDQWRFVTSYKIISYQLAKHPELNEIKNE